MKFRIPRTLMQSIRELLDTVRTPSLALWALYILLFPLYVLPSGIPQPGDLLLLPLGAVVLGGGALRVHPGGVRPVRALLLFTGYVVVSSLLWSAVTGKFTINAKDGFLLTPLFYVYNAAFFVLALTLYRRYRERFLWLTLQSVLLSVLLQAVLSLVLRGGAGRTIITFNNPNQLGYFALASASILALGRRRIGLNATAATIGLVVCGYLAVLSSSKAALGAVLILVAAGTINNPRRALLACGFFALLTTLPTPLTSAIERARHRIETDEHLGFFEERGYDRIVNHKEYWLLGAGEGGTRRFKESTFIGAHEIHSSIGTLFFCYGIIGLGLFTSLAYQIARGSSIRTWALLLPVAAYGMTHQGLRSTLLWALLAFFICVRDFELTTRRRAQAASGTAGDASRTVVMPTSATT